MLIENEYQKEDEIIKILLVVRWPVGGIRTFLRYVYSNFEKSKYFITVIAPGFEKFEVFIVDIENINVRFFHVEDLPVDGSPGYWVMLKKILNVARRNNFDVVHSHGFTSGLCSLFPALFFKIPHLMTCHDVINEKQFEGIAGKQKKIALSILFHFVKYIHCVSNDAKNNLLRYFPYLKFNQKLVTIPNGIEPKRFLIEEREDFRQIEGVEQSDYLVGFFGRFMAQKGFRYLVDAVEILSSQSLPRNPKVICFGWGGFIREEQKMLTDRGLDRYFIFLPFRDNPAKAIRGMDVVVMPSLWEAYGLLAAETLVAGTPLIGSDCIGLREVLGGTPARMVPAGSAKKLSEAIIQEMLNPSWQKAAEFREEASKRFDVNNQVVALKNLINDVCKNKKISFSE